jgi:hypothetical protein
MFQDKTNKTSDRFSPLFKEAGRCNLSSLDYCFIRSRVVAKVGSTTNTSSNGKLLV